MQARRKKFVGLTGLRDKDVRQMPGVTWSGEGVIDAARKCRRQWLTLAKEPYGVGDPSVGVTALYATEATWSDGNSIEDSHKSNMERQKQH